MSTLAEVLHAALVTEYGCRHPLYMPPQCEVMAARLSSDGVSTDVTAALSELAGSWRARARGWEVAVGPSAIRRAAVSDTLSECAEMVEGLVRAAVSGGSGGPSEAARAPVEGSLRDLFDIRHAIGEPCGEWMGGRFICGCAEPTVGPRATCVRCHHAVRAVPK